MEQAVSTQSINDINGALLAQYAADRKLAMEQAKAAKNSSFADTLDSLQGTAQKAVPTPLIDLNGKAKPLYSSATTAPEPAARVVEVEEEPVHEFKIVRGGEKADSYREMHVSYQDDNLGWEDVADFLNPLQHIPVIGTIYRALTGDNIKPEVQVAGSLAFGAATGSVLLSGVAGIASALYEQKTGQEPTVMVADSLFGSETVQVSDAQAEKKIVVAQNNTIDQTEPTARVDQQTLVEGASKVQAESTINQSGAMAVQASAVKSKPKTLAGRLAAAQATAGATRIGNTIHAGNTLKNTTSNNRVAMVTPVSSQAKAQASEAVSTTEKASTSLPVVSDDTFNVLLQEQAQARQAGQKVDPQTVQGLMLKALDKYQAMAQTSENSAGSQVTAVQ